MTVISDTQSARLYIYIDSKKMLNFVIYKKPDILQKPRQFLLRF